MAFGSGVSFWSFGLYVEPLESDFGWSRAQVSFGFSSALLVAGIAGPFVGWWIDRRGPRSAILLGATMTTLTCFLLATTSSLWQWYVYQAINAVFRQMMFFIPFQALISRWFDRKRGVALSVLATGFSLGGFVVVPIMSLVIEVWDWDGSFIFAGIATAVIFLPIGLLVVKNRPEDAGTWVDGIAGEADESGTSPPSKVTGIPARVALRTPIFWVLAAGLGLFFFGLFGWLVHQVPFYESEGFSRRAASFIVSGAAGAGIISRLAFGFVADKVKRFEYVAMTLGALLAAARTILFFNSGPVGIGVFLAFWLVGTGGGPMLEALLLTRAFGVAYFATILGAVVVVETIGQILSPTLAGYIFDRTGSYDAALLMYVGTFLASMLLFLIASRMRRPVDDLHPAI